MGRETRSSRWDTCTLDNPLALLGCIPADRTQQEPLIGMLRLQVPLH